MNHGSRPNIFDSKKQTIFIFQKHVVTEFVTRIFTYIFGNDVVGEGTYARREQKLITTR